MGITGPASASISGRAPITMGIVAITGPITTVPIITGLTTIAPIPAIMVIAKGRAAAANGQVAVRRAGAVAVAITEVACGITGADLADRLKP